MAIAKMKKSYSTLISMALLMWSQRISGHSFQFLPLDRSPLFVWQKVVDAPYVVTLSHKFVQAFFNSSSLARINKISFSCFQKLRL